MSIWDELDFLDYEGDDDDYMAVWKAVRDG